MTPLRRILSVGALILPMVSCSGDGTTGPGLNAPPIEPGTIALDMRASGTTLDPDGYTVRLDGIDRGDVAVKGTTWLRAVPAGVAEIRLEGVDEACSVVGGNPRTVAVPAGDVVRVMVDVVCTAAPAPEVP